jgi:hypothetical protein
MSSSVLFDASIHLGQFCIQSDQTRLACKHSQGALASTIGIWTDTENGRVDNAIWTLPRVLQDEFYPFMDRFFSIMRIDQIQLAEGDAKFAMELMKCGLHISFQSAYICSVAISQKAQELQTLYSDLLKPEASTHIQTHFGLSIRQPPYDENVLYADTELESAYQRALSAFTDANVDVLDHMLQLRRNS